MNLYGSISAGFQRVLIIPDSFVIPFFTTDRKSRFVLSRYLLVSGIIKNNVGIFTAGDLINIPVSAFPLHGRSRPVSAIHSLLIIIYIYILPIFIIKMDFCITRLMIIPVTVAIPYVSFHRIALPAAARVLVIPTVAEYNLYLIPVIYGIRIPVISLRVHRHARPGFSFMII